MEKVFETQEEMTGYITGKVKGGFIANVEDCHVLCLPLKLTFVHLKNRPFNEYTGKSNSYKNR